MKIKSHESFIKTKKLNNSNGAPFFISSKDLEMRLVGRGYLNMLYGKQINTFANDPTQRLEIKPKIPYLGTSINEQIININPSKIIAIEDFLISNFALVCKRNKFPILTKEI